MVKEAPPINNVAHIVRNALVILKYLAGHCTMCHSTCPMLDRIGKAELDLNSILKGKELTNDPARFFS